MKKDVLNYVQENEQMLDRSDKKWGHPLLREGWPENNGTDPLAMFNLIYNIQPTKEQFAQGKSMRDMMQTNFDSLPVAEGISEDCKSSVDVVEYQIPPCSAEPDAPLLRALCCIPKNSEGKRLPVILLIPGGGLIGSSATGAATAFQPAGIELAHENQAVVIVPQYRTLPDSPYPIPLNDCQACFEWIVNNMEHLPIDPDNVTLGGTSSGGHIALCLGFRLKRLGYHLRGIIANHPITDDRQNKMSSKILPSFGEWNGELVKKSSVAYLGAYNSGSAGMGPEAYANYASVQQCIGYPPTFIVTSEFDPDRDYNREFFGKLLEANVYAEYYMRAGGGHAASAIQSPGTAEFMEPITYILKNMFYNATHYDLRRPWSE